VNSKAEMTPLLDCLAWAKARTAASKQAAATVEYRLLCSGELYLPNLIGNWRKSDGARLLLANPVQLMVASQPYDGYPQELVLQFQKRSLEVSDAEIADDLSALLTLLCRRLVTVLGKVRTVFTDPDLPPWMRDWPAPVFEASPVYWKPRPATIISGIHGSEVQFHDPAPRGFDAAWIRRFLDRLPELDSAENIVRVARLYVAAMGQVETQPEAAYQLLISATDSMAGIALKSWKPEEAELLANESDLLKALKEARVADDVANSLALVAGKKRPWNKRRFVKFLMENADWSSFGQPDDLFIVPDFLQPTIEDREKVLKRVYDHRSGASHSGQEFPASASVGSSPMIPRAAVYESLTGEKAFPPIGWFERVVRSAMLNHLKKVLDS